MDSENQGRRGAGTPAFMWVVAAALWMVTIVIVALTGEDEMSLSRAFLYLAVCIGVGAWTAVIAALLSRLTIPIAVVVVALASQIGRAYLDNDLALSVLEVALVGGVSAVVFVASRALADQIAPS